MPENVGSVIRGLGQLHSRVNHALRRIEQVEKRGPGPWIYIGTPGLDGADIYIADNPAPWNASPWIPFENGWTNSLGVDPPVSFANFSGWIHIRGGFVGGGNGSTVFTLPPAFRPTFNQRCVIGTSQVNHYATITIQTDGQVVFGQIV